MATLRYEIRCRVPVGGEEKRFEVSRDLTVIGQAIADPTVSIPENTPGTPRTLYQSAGHGIAAPVAEFSRGFFAVDASKLAANAGLADLSLDLELSYTSQAGAVSTRVVRVPPDIAFLFGPEGGATGAAMTDVLTRIRTTNPAGVGSPAGSNDREGRLLLVK